MKKLCALLLAFAMLFAFAGCGASKDTTAASGSAAQAAADKETAVDTATLFEALSNTAKAIEEGKNLTVNLSANMSVVDEPTPGLKRGYDMNATADLQIHCDPDAQELTVYGQTNTSGMYETILVHDGWNVSTYFIDDTYYKEDISDDLEEMFKTSKDAEGSSLEDILDQIPEEYLEQIEEVFDSSLLLELLQSLIEEKLQDEEWLKETFGYSSTQDGDTIIHTFELDLADVFNGLLTHFKDAFIDEESYDEALDSLDDLENLDETVKDLVLKLELTQTGNQISAISLYLKGTDAETSQVYEITAVLTFSKIGTTEIDFDALDAILDSLDEYDDSYYDSYYDEYEYIDEDTPVLEEL